MGSHQFLVTPRAIDTFSPPDIAGLKLWLKADALGLSDNDPVSSWPDSSSEGNDATQASGTKQPIFKAAIVNGKPVVRFDGSNDLMELTDELPNSASVFVVVAKKGAFTAQSPFVENSGSAGGGILFWARTNGSTNWGSFSTAFADVPSGDDLVTDVFTLVELTTSGADGLKLYGNGTLKTTAAQSYGGPGPKSTIGGQIDNSVFANIDMAEIVIYDTVLSAPNRVLVENYLMDKYAI